MKDKIYKFDKVLIFFAVLYPVIPAYFKIVGFSFPNLCCISFILIALIYKKIRLVLKKNIVVFSLLLWMMVNAFIYIYHSYYFGAIWTICTVIAGLIYVDNIKKQSVFINIIIAIVYVSGVICLLGIIEAISGFNIFSFLNTSGDKIMINPARFGLTRIVGFSYQTISYSVYMIICACFAVYLLNLKNVLNNRSIVRVRCIYILIVINIFLSLSRSAIIIFLMSQMLFLWKMGMKKVIKTIVIAFFICCILLFFLSYIAPSVFHQVKNLYYMIIAVFDSNYTSFISKEFGKDNLNAIGTRKDIYGWVYEKVRNNLLLGVGFKTPFSYKYDSGNLWHTMITKSAIEVEYLLTLYESGIIGLLSEIFVFLSLICSCLKNNFKCTVWENKISFNFLSFVIFISMILMYFMVNQSSEQYVFNILICLFLAYNFRIKKGVNNI